jgi:hypothetical protein
MTKAQGLPPYNCPACSTQVSSVENEDGTRWQVEVLFPAGTTQREARRYLEEAGVTEDVVTVLIEQGHQEVGAGVWKMLDRKK